MGYGLMAYSVSIEKVVAACGSGDDGLRRAISGRFKTKIASVNDQLGYSNERGEPSVFEAIRHLITGQEKTLNGALYGYGFEYIVRFYGRFLDNGRFYPAPWMYLVEEFASELKQTGAVVNMFDLMTAAPLRLPPPDDFPNYGHWTAADVAASVEPVRQAENKSEELQAIAQWLEFAAGRSEGIVGYYY